MINPHEEIYESVAQMIVDECSRRQSLSCLCNRWRVDENDFWTFLDAAYNMVVAHTCPAQDVHNLASDLPE